MRGTEFNTGRKETQAKFHDKMKKWHKIFIQRPLPVSSPEEMKILGSKIGELLEPGETIAIAGNLGAGKTHLTQGIMKGLGSAQDALSPTFSIVHEHKDGRIPAYHFDFYRLKSERELETIGWDDYLDRNGVTIIEWADMFPHAIPEDATWLLISHRGENKREVDIKFYQTDN